MLRHDLGNDLVLLLELGFKASDLFLLLGILGAGPPAFEGRGSILKKGLLPLVKERRVDLVLVAHVGDRCVLDEVFTKDGDFLLRRVVAASFHGDVLSMTHSINFPSDFSNSG